MARTLVVTNDFPPRTGGIQSFVAALVARQDPDTIVVYAPAWPGAAQFDAAAAYPVVRHRGALMLPVPTVAGHAAELVRRFGASTVLFGAAVPLGLLAPGLREAGVRRAVGLTHGHEAAWAQAPGANRVLRRVAADLDVLTYLGPFTGSRIARALRPADRAKLVRLHPGVDARRFAPGPGAARRAALGLAGRPVVVCVSRLVPRKGQDTLIRALPTVRSVVPDACLLVVGSGPHEWRLRELAARTGLAEHVRFTGGVSDADLPGYYGAGDVFAMPCRTRRRGLEVEGLGMVFLEASACGLPVVAGDSGGAPEAVIEGRTGTVVDGRSVPAVAAAVTRLLSDPALVAEQGSAGRDWVLAEWGWAAQAARLGELLAGA
ncbi:MAG TPA: glycosyltransferase family 4 protein [Sporichthyaceae bacterium]|jgi:phosphatidylinositol alpha-1,6-mannosyltransferase|nr:glycosyltransferase family 4 protein [Sporichthyaceae bacterium]